MPFLSRLFGRKTHASTIGSQVTALENARFRFIAVDVETANSDPGSICQIGLALVAAGNSIQVLSQIVDPQQAFDDFNVQLHGIDRRSVSGQPSFEECLATLRPLLERHTLIQHSAFDKRAFNAACQRYNQPAIRSEWIDSVRIARKAWPELKGNGGHGLASLKKHLGLDFDHHDAGEDARAAAEVVLRAEEVTGIDFSKITASGKNGNRGHEVKVAIPGNESGPLFGQTACFTGKLNLARTEAASLAARAGITVKASVSRKVTLLVVGDQDLSLLAGHDKSTKHRRAEELIEEGHDIKIIGETEFVALVQTAHEDI